MDALKSLAELFALAELLVKTPKTRVEFNGEIKVTLTLSSSHEAALLEDLTQSVAQMFRDDERDGHQFIPGLKDQIRLLKLEKELLVIQSAIAGIKAKSNPVQSGGQGGSFSPTHYPGGGWINLKDPKGEK